jgi:hypothetical protein
MRRNLLGTWYKRAEACHKCHFLASHRYSKYNYLIGIPTILFTAAVGTSVFASLSTTSRSVLATIIIGFFSILATILSSLQTFLGFSEHADRHRDAGVKYGIIGRKMELLLNENTMPNQPEALALKKDLDELATASPKIPLDILKSFGSLYTDESLNFDITQDTALNKTDTGVDISLNLQR